MTFLASPGSRVPGRSCQQRCLSHALRTEPPAMRAAGRTGSAGLSHHFHCGQAGNIPRGWQPPYPCTSTGDMEPPRHPMTAPKRSQPHCRWGDRGRGGAGDPPCVALGWRRLCGRSSAGTSAGCGEVGHEQRQLCSEMWIHPQSSSTLSLAWSRGGFSGGAMAAERSLGKACARCAPCGSCTACKAAAALLGREDEATMLQGDFHCKERWQMSRGEDGTRSQWIRSP